MKIFQHSAVITVTVFSMKESGGYWRLYGDLTVTCDRWLGSQIEGSYQGHKERNWDRREWKEVIRKLLRNPAVTKTGWRNCQW